jgi:acyl-CoA reductase-like NAD-dependent aldehyde dehydrogenase
MNTLIRLQSYSFAVKTYSNFYGGQFVPSKATKFYEIYNPVTQEHIARVPQSSEE